MSSGRRGSWWALAAAAAGLALLAGCGSDASTSPPVTTTPAPAASGAFGAVPAVLDFDVPAVSGGRVTGATYAGKPVAFWFWAPG